ncbi:MAG: PKD domain-containing protein [Bacteroidales bacterium]|nr:PKD domain-containing protein [Bacteroidales bacterium]
MKNLVHNIASTILLTITLSAFSQATIHTIVLRPGPADGIDAELRTDMPQTPRGTSPDFIANAWTAQGNYFVQRSLLKFDLSQIPVEANVLQATLFLYTNLTTGHYQLDSGANAAYLFRVAEPWSEDLACWNNQPSISPSASVFLPQSISNTQNYDVNVTTHVNEMVKNPAGNYGWMFKLETEEKYRCMVFASSDNLNEEWRPKLVIQYTLCTNPVAGFSFTINSHDVQFNDNSSPAQSWYWTFGDGSSSSEQNPSHHYTNPGDYQVCLEIEDSCGTSTHCDIINIECTLPQTGFIYDDSYKTVEFTDTSLCPYPIAWFWEFGDSSTSAEQNPVHTYSDCGFYNVCLTISDSCGQNMTCEWIGVCSTMKPEFTSSQNETNNLMIAFEDHTAGATWWRWEFGDGKTSAKQNPVHLYEKYGEYEVCLTAGNASDQETACHPLKVKKINIKGPANSILFYPNPTSSDGLFYFILFEDSGLVEISVTDLTGKIILRQEYKAVRNNEPIALNINKLSKGTYIIEGSFNNYRRVTKLVVF